MTLLKLTKCDYSAGKKILLLTGKHKHRIVTVAGIMRGQGGPSHEVIIIEEKGITGEDNYF